MRCLLTSKSYLSRAFSTTFSDRRIDTHHHVIPDFLTEAIELIGGDPSGLHLPAWSLAESKDQASSLGIESAIISVSSPGATLARGEKSRTLARRLNDYCSRLSQDDPSRFGFFASLPHLTDIEGTLEEIDYAFNVLKADGVIVFTSYQKDIYYNYLGHPTFKPIWDKLDSYKAVVFVHATKAPTTRVDSYLPQPLIDYPHEVTRTAADLVLTGTVKAHPDIRFILAQSGGTLPYLYQRISYAGMFPALHCPLTTPEILAGFSSLYFDVAVSTNSAQLKGLAEVARPDKILYGSDLPYAPVQVAKFENDFLDSYFANKGEQGEKLLKKINRENALALFPNKFSSK